MSTSSPQTLHVLITGHVQAVGFRISMQRAAELRGVVGWVRNRADGNVEAVIQGSDDAIGSLLEWTGQGPRGARVERVDSSPLETDELFAGFEIRR
jgi:acylphosphatase